LRITDCGYMSLFNCGLEIEIESLINQQSAISNPTSRSNWGVYQSFARALGAHRFQRALGQRSTENK